MIAKDLISDIVSALNVDDTGENALKWMDVFRVSHLPVVDNKRYVGLISDNDIYDYNNTKDLIKNHHLSLMEASVNENQHIYDVFDIMSRFKLSTVPVLNKNKNFVGLITVFDLMQNIDSVIGLRQVGSIIVLEVNTLDFSLLEIAQIIESDNKKIISIYLKNSQDDRSTTITIKINTDNISSLLKSFDRYEYKIVFSSSPDHESEQLIEDRYNFFMKYLNL